MLESTLPPSVSSEELEGHRPALRAYCYRMLGSPFDAEDAVQETMIRALRSLDRFEGRSAVGSWLHRIATNVCLDMIKSSRRRATPMDLGAACEPVESNLNIPAAGRWIEPMPEAMIATGRDPAEIAAIRDSVRLALVAALQHLPARQRAALILHEVLRWEASEIAELLDTSVAAVNSSLQRARATLARRNVNIADRAAPLSDADRALLDRFVKAFERYDFNSLTTLIREDVSQSMPPFDMWLSGREDVLRWWFGPGIGCQDSRLIPVGFASGRPAFGQYKPSPDGGREAWALVVLELSGGLIEEFTFFLDTERLFPLFGLPPRLDA